MAKVDAHMACWRMRSLSAGEIALASAIFADEIAWPKLRILQAPRLGFTAMVPLGRTIIYANWRARADFADAPLAEQGWFIHELAHAWQAARGNILALAKLRALGKRAYAYKPDRARLAAYNIEQQAEIVRHLFLARAGEPAKDSPPLAWLERIWAERAMPAA
jgi:hypothetical protein